MKVVISGWYGCGNVGDEAILAALINEALKTVPRENITIMSFNPKHTRKHHLVKSVHQLPISGVKSWVNFFVKFRFVNTVLSLISVDKFWLGGGGMLSDFQPEVPFGWLKQIAIVKIFGGNTVLKNIGAGPFFTKKGSDLVRKYINLYADSVVVRDQPSFNCLKAVGVCESKLELDIDPVAGMELDFPVRSIAALEAAIGVVYCDYYNSRFWNGFSERRQALFNAMLAQLETLISRGKKVVLVMFQPSNSQERSLYYRLKSAFPDEDISIVEINDYRDAFSVVNSLGALISFRFHGNVIAYRLGRPFLPIIYHHKTAGFLERINMKDVNKIVVSDGRLLDVQSSSLVEWETQTLEFIEKLDRGPEV